jgi:hypothetical protein
MIAAPVRVSPLALLRAGCPATPTLRGIVSVGDQVIHPLPSCGLYATVESMPIFRCPKCQHPYHRLLDSPTSPQVNYLLCYGCGHLSAETKPAPQSPISETQEESRNWSLPGSPN